MLLTSRSVIGRFHLLVPAQITKFMGPTWGPPGSCRPQMGPMLAPWTLLSGKSSIRLQWLDRIAFPVMSTCVICPVLALCERWAFYSAKKKETRACHLSVRPPCACVCVCVVRPCFLEGLVTGHEPVLVRHMTSQSKAILNYTQKWK